MVKIELIVNSPSCTPQCKEYLDYISGYASASEMTLAVILAKEYKNANEKNEKHLIFIA